MIAISPNPFLVKATSALTSPRLFPQERTVKERSAYGRVVIKPKSLSKSTTQLEVKLTHAILIINAKKEKNIYAPCGGDVFLVQKNKQMEKGIIATPIPTPIINGMKDSACFPSSLTSHSDNYPKRYNKVIGAVIGVMAALVLSQASSSDIGIV